MPSSLPAPFKLDRLKKRATPRVWESALKLVRNEALTWTWEAVEGGVVAIGMLPTSHSLLHIQVSWSGASLRTSCSCPKSGTKPCAHRVALGLLLYQALTEQTGGTVAAEAGAALEASVPPARASGRSMKKAVEAQSTWRSTTIEGERPVPVLTVSEVSGGLSAQLEFSYGAVKARVSAARPESVSRVEIDGASWSVTRDRYRESRFEWRLHEAGLSPAGGGMYTCTGDALPGFVLEGTKRLQAEGWQLVGLEALELLARPREITFSVKIRRRIDWFVFDVRSEAGGTSIPVVEVLAAWRAGRRFIALPQGGYARVPEEWLQESGALLEAVQALPAAGKEGVKVAACQVPLAAAVADRLEARDVDPGFTSLRVRLAEPTAEVPPLPRGLRASLRGYQEAGLAWMHTLRRLELGGILADDMGLGKTVQVLAMLQAAKEDGAAGPTLIVVPTSVLENWVREAARFTPELSVVVFHGPGRLELPGLDQADVLVTSYGLIRRDLRYHLGRTYQYVVLDEAQAIKNPASETSRACRRLKARHRLTMTGTPLENRLLELWSQFAFVMPALLGTEATFQERYALPIERDGDTRRQDELRRRVAPFILRRLKEDVAPELPPLTEDVLHCDLAPDQAALYQATLKAGRVRVFQAVNAQGLDRARFAVLELLLKLRQICCHPGISGLEPDGRPVGSAKLELFRDTVREIVEGGHRLLIFSQFVQMLKVLQRELEALGIEYLYLDGSTKGRQALVDRFNGSSIPAFLISLKAGGTGLNLTGADYVVHYDPWWNPAVEAQATDRAHRIGQTRPVIAYKLITRGTVEEKMLELHARKRALAEGLLAADGAAMGRLTAEDLEFLFPND